MMSFYWSTFLWINAAAALALIPILAVIIIMKTRD